MMGGDGPASSWETEADKNWFKVPDVSNAPEKDTNVNVYL